LHQSDLSSVAVDWLASLDNSGPGALTFIESKKHQASLAGLVAAAIFCPEELVDKVPAGVAVLVTQNPHRDFAATGRLLYPSSVRPVSLLGETGISAQAYVHPAASLEEGVTVEAGAVIGKNVEIGTGTLVSATAVIAENSKVGRDCYIGPGVSVQHALIGNRVTLHAGVRIGQDGFGYVAGSAGVEKVPQLGCVVIQDDVEIGAR